jgi:hypothetical protein
MMRERDIIRTAESMADSLDARLAAMTPRDRMYAEEMARGFRDFVCFLIGIGGAVLACLAIG